MDRDARKIAAKHFCEEELIDWYSANSLNTFYADRQIASLRLLSLRTSVGFDCVEIKRIDEDVPDSVSENFERHFWYSQYSLSDLYLIKISIGHAPIFIFLIHGFCDDGWDNGGCWLEILDEQGAFLCSATFDDERIRWREERIHGNNFSTPAPPWIGDTPNAITEQPMWTEEIVARRAVSTERDGARIRYIVRGRV